MLWRRSASSLLTPSTVPVPDAEALRRAALQASWQRGRWVARRRVAWRWLLWISTRYLMPAALVFGLGAWLWLGVLPRATEAWPPLARWAGWSGTAPPVANTPVQAPAPEPASSLPAAPPVAESVTNTVEFSPEGEALITPLRLRVDTRWNTWAQPTQAAADSAARSPAAETVSESFPPLKPENWLHSKEP